MSPFIRHGLVLGIFTAVGPLGTDMYLPALPVIARDLGTADGAAQLSLMSFFVALAVGQAVYGPMSDILGRRRPLMFGFALDVLASIGCVYAPNVTVLIILRFVQGLGACAGMVVARAAARDLYSGPDVARLFAFMMLVLGVSPILAPFIGSTIIALAPWSAIFWAQAAFGALCLVLTLCCFSETHAPEKRMEAGLRPAFATYGRLLLDGRFVGIVMASSMIQAGFFAYLAGSPFDYITLHGVSPSFYSLLFGVNAIGLIGMAQMNGRLMRRFGALVLIRSAILVNAAAGITLLLLARFQLDGLIATAVLFFILTTAMGCTSPTGSMLALDRHGNVAGSASALMGAVQFAVGALSSAAVGALFNGSSVPMAAIIAGCGVASFALSRVYLITRKGAFP